MKNLLKLSDKERENFLKSFDIIFCDLDGVIWYLFKKIPKSDEAIELLKQNGKKVRFVSNNTAMSCNRIAELLCGNGIPTMVEDIITPTNVIIEYLKKEKFNKNIFIIGNQSIKNELIDAGFKVAEDPPNYIEETIPNLLKNIEDNTNIGAVIVDFDLNLNFIKIQKACIYLKRPDTLFLAGATDKLIPINLNLTLFGSKFTVELLEDICKRKPLHYAKPSCMLENYIKKVFDVKDPNRVLFIGDSCENDIGFADKCGFKKLLVLSGITKIEDFDIQNFPKDQKPDYYLESLGDICNILKK